MAAWLGRDRIGFDQRKSSCTTSARASRPNWTGNYSRQVNHFKPVTQIDSAWPSLRGQVQLVPAKAGSNKQAHRMRSAKHRQYGIV